ncbi:hypothetical protein [Bacillus sp. AK031]
MKDRELKKLFQEIDSNEGTSVDFETVWRKTNRQSWLDRYFHSLKHNIAILCTLLILAPIIGSLVVNNPFSFQSNKEANLFNSEFIIEGNVTRLDKDVLINGDSALPQGTMLQAKIKHGDRGGIIQEKEIEIGKEGSFSLSFQLPDDSKEYLVTIELFPHLQDAAIQKTVGERGEQLYNSSQVSGVYHYYIENELHTGIRLYGEVKKEFHGQSKIMFGSLKSAHP